MCWPTSHHPTNQGSMSVCESEMSEIKKCVPLHHVAHRGRFHGTVEQLCSIIFSFANLLDTLNDCAAGII